MRHLVPATLVLTALIAGCQPAIKHDENSPYFAPPIGSQLILKKPVAIKADDARAYFQNGAIVPRTIDYFTPHCQLEVNNVMPVTQTLQPDTFTITQVSRKTFDVVQVGNTQLARVGFGIGIGLGFGDDGVSDIMYAWQMKLSSAKQPHVRMLICGGVFDKPVDAEYPSINEMRRALGDYGELITPASPDRYAPRETPAAR